MEYVRTQIYLEPRQHRQLKHEAHRRGISLAQLLRELVDAGLGPAQTVGGDLTGLIALGDSTRPGQPAGDIGRHKDRYLADAVAAKINPHR